MRAKKILRNFFAVREKFLEMGGASVLASRNKIRARLARTLAPPEQGLKFSARYAIVHA
jgi:hypothetical protein